MATILERAAAYFLYTSNETKKSSYYRYKGLTLCVVYSDYNDYGLTLCIVYSDCNHSDNEYPVQVYMHIAVI